MDGRPPSISRSCTEGDLVAKIIHTLMSQPYIFITEKENVEVGCGGKFRHCALSCDSLSLRLANREVRLGGFVR